MTERSSTPATPSGIPVRVFPTPEALGETLAARILAGVAAARTEGRRYLLGCPGGRSLLPTYRALARAHAAGADLAPLVVVMMDDYLVPDGRGGLRRADADAHYSCERFGREEIAAPLGVAPEDVWLPDPADPAAYDRRLVAAGGVDCFLAASGASDGHVAFNPPGADPDGESRVIPLAETTRRDNMATFPDFRSLDEVPTKGVSVGLGTIRRVSREIVLVLTGEGKRAATARLLGTPAVDPAWPATFVRGCARTEIWLDEAAAGSAPASSLR